MNSYKKLIKNSSIFAIASLGSKFISIILVPFYTYVLSTDEYGTIDMLNTTITLLAPVITLSIYDAVLRFAVKSEYKYEKILTCALAVLFVGNLLFLLFIPIFHKMDTFKNYIIIFYLVLFFQSINTLLCQFARGSNHIKEFAFNGVMYTFLMLIFNIITLKFLYMGILGYFLSMLLSNIISNIYYFLTLRIWRYVSKKFLDSKLVKEMITYSIPLIPNALMWWIMSVSDRYMITYFIGIAANGLYAVANKIPTVLSLIDSVFYQAWQLSAIEEGESKDKSKFYSRVFEVYSSIMLVASSLILLFLKLCVDLVLGEEYKNIWIYVPFLLIGAVFTSFSTFLGTNYIAMKKTQGVFKTSLISAIINIILNIILIPSFGINGASFSTMISVFILWIIRIFDTREFIKMKINMQKIIITLLLLGIQSLALILNIKYNYFIQIISCILLIINNLRSLVYILGKINIYLKGKLV